MTTRLQELIRAGAALGVLGLAACAVEAPTRASPGATTAPPATMTSALESGFEACPVDEGEIARICRDLNAGRAEDQVFDYFVPRTIHTGERLTVCACPGVSVCVDGEAVAGEFCPAQLAEQPFRGHEVLYSATVEGSHCESLCKASTGGTGQVYTQCVTNCKASH